jgi:hypothetical protein
VAELKTKKTTASVAKFLDSIPDAGRRADCRKIAAIMKRATKVEPRMWGPSIVGFGDFAHRYASGRTGDWPITGFSPRKQNLTLYIMCGFEWAEPMMKKLGKYTTGKSCLYIKSLDDVDVGVLTKLIEVSVKKVKTFQN